MTNQFAETVDQALSRLAAGEPLPDVLANFPDEKDTLLPLLESAVHLDVLVDVPLPDAELMAADRQAFLAAAEARQGQRALISANGSRALAAPVAGGAVSISFLGRLKEWIDEHVALPAFPVGAHKERNMGTLLLKAAFAFILTFGTVGGTVAVSADSLPGSPVYPVKLAVERARLAVNADPAGDADLHLAFAEERVEEMARIVNEGGAPDEATMNQLQLHLEEAIALAAQQPDEKMFQMLIQAQNVIQTQEAVMERVQTGPGEPVQAQVQAMVQAMQQLGLAIEDGLQDPQAFRFRYGFNRPETAPAQPDLEPGGVLTHTRPVTSPHGYGPGPGDPDCIQAGDCEPQGLQNQHQAPPSEPGEYGNEDCQQGGEACEPVGDQYQWGPQDEQAGPGSDGAAGTPNEDPGGSDMNHGVTNGHNGGDGGNTDSGGDNGGSGGNGGGNGGG